MAEMEPEAIKAAADARFRALVWGMHSALEEREFPASQEYCPKDTLQLVGTAHLSDPRFTDEGAEIVISYGSAEAGDTGIYAVVQHERMDYRHPNGGQAKYLERAVVEGQPTINLRAVAHAEAFK
jgi:hypothetical protein